MRGMELVLFGRAVPSGGILGSFPQQQDSGDQGSLLPFDGSPGSGRGILAPLERINVARDQHAPAWLQPAVPVAGKAAAPTNAPRPSLSAGDGSAYSRLPPRSDLPLPETPVRLAQWWAPIPLLFARPPVIIPRQLTPLEELPPGSSGGAEQDGHSLGRVVLKSRKGLHASTVNSQPQRNPVPVL